MIGKRFLDARGEMKSFKNLRMETKIVHVPIIFLYGDETVGEIDLLGAYEAKKAKSRTDQEGELV